MAQTNRLDLNLLLVFEAVLQTKSVTAAGAQLGLTQSAASNALNRLRSTLGDPLFVRTSEGMVPTPRAQEIAGPLRESIERIRQAMGSILRLIPPPPIGCSESSWPIPDR